MHPKILIAIAVAGLFIAGAAWSRWPSREASAPQLSAAEREEADAAYEEFLKDLLDAPATSTPPEEITGTDVISRQLILDYIALAKGGQATPSALNQLAEKYVENFPNLVSTRKLGYMDLNIVSNAKSNFILYGDSFSKIYADYSSRLFSLYDGSRNLSLSPENLDMMGRMGMVYKETGEKLSKLAVPGQVAEAHLELANLFFENSAAMSAIAGANSDPASSFAGLIKVRGNTEKEEELLSTIEEILTANGI